MRIVATIEVEIPDFDEESKSQWEAFKKLERNPEEMIERIYTALDESSPDVVIHSPHMEQGGI